MGNDADRQYIYFIEVAWHRHKIGITGNIENRLSRLQKLNGKRAIRIHKVAFVRGAYSLEQRILKLFSDKQIHYRKFRGSGATEVMGLTWLECMLVILKIWIHQHRGKIKVIISILLAGIVSYAVNYLTSN
jgi:hypothetical protein